MMRNKVFITGMISILLVFGFMFVACSNESEDTDKWLEITGDTGETEIPPIEEFVGTWEGSSNVRFAKQVFPLEVFPSDFQGILSSFDINEITTSSAASLPVELDLTFELTNDGPVAAISGTIDLESVLDAVAKSPELNDIVDFLNDPETPEIPEIAAFFPKGTALSKDVLWELITGLYAELPGIIGDEGGEDLPDIALSKKYELTVKDVPVELDEFISSDGDESEYTPKVEINEGATKIRISFPINDELTAPVKLDGNAIVIIFEKQ
jgi:hypothetical protein